MVMSSPHSSFSPDDFVFFEGGSLTSKQSSFELCVDPAADRGVKVLFEPCFDPAANWEVFCELNCEPSVLCLRKCFVNHIG